MIAYLAGTILFKQTNSVIVDIGGVGYEVTIPLSTLYEMGEAGTQVALRIHTYVREDVLQLYGFKTARERELFLRLISVSGVGPKLGITALSVMNAEEIIGAIRSNNLARLTSIPGVGKKTAERLVIELRDKINNLSSPAIEESLKIPGTTSQTNVDAIREDTLSALVNFGYQKAAAEKAVSTAMKEDGDISVETLLKRSLRLLSKA
jgi:holliday junction DNA helicase RuvA